jgi:hypothetical protein
VPSEGEIRNRRITAVVLVVAAAVGIVAAADVGPFADETEEDRVRATVERFIAARDERDFGTVCGMLTATLKREVQATSGAEPGAEPPSCVEVLQSQAASGSEREDGAAAEIVDVSVSGNRSRASLERAEGISRSITLEMVAGDWLVSTFES